MLKAIEYARLFANLKADGTWRNTGLLVGCPWTSCREREKNVFSAAQKGGVGRRRDDARPSWLVHSDRDRLVAPEAVERASSRFPSFGWCFETPVLENDQRAWASSFTPWSLVS